MCCAKSCVHKWKGNITLSAQVAPGRLCYSHFLLLICFLGFNSVPFFVYLQVSAWLSRLNFPAEGKQRLMYPKSFLNHVWTATQMKVVIAVKEDCLNCYCRISECYELVKPACSGTNRSKWTRKCLIMPFFSGVSAWLAFLLHLHILCQCIKVPRISVWGLALLWNWLMACLHPIKFRGDLQSLCWRKGKRREQPSSFFSPFTSFWV